MESRRRGQDDVLAFDVPHVTKAENADSDLPVQGAMFWTHGWQQVWQDPIGNQSCKDEHCGLLERLVEESDSWRCICDMHRQTAHNT